MIGGTAVMTPSMPGGGHGAGGASNSAASAVAGASAAPAPAPGDVAQPVVGGHDTAPAAAKPKSATRDGNTDFDSLLADASAPAAVAATPPAASPVAMSAAEHADAPLENALPDQLLALLDGSWALPPVAPPPGTVPVGADAALANATGLAQTGLAQGALISALPVSAGSLQPAAGQVGAALAETALPAAIAVAADAGSAAAPTLAAIAAGEPGVAGASIETSGSGLLTELASTEPAPLTATAPTAPAATRAAGAIPTAAIPLPADPDAGFDDAFGARIAWLAEQRLGHAEIRVSPDHAGPIDVRLQLDGSRVSAEFQSANPEVRRALEASLTQLRELLGQHGMQLAHAGVGHGPPDRRRGAMASPGHDSEHDAALEPRMNASPIPSARGLLDEYA